MRLPKIRLPNISDEEKIPVVLQLIEIIEQISVVIQQQAEEIQRIRIDCESEANHNLIRLVGQARLLYKGNIFF